MIRAIDAQLAVQRGVEAIKLKISLRNALVTLVVLVAVFVAFSIRIDHLTHEDNQQRMVEISTNNAISVQALFNKDFEFLHRAAEKWDNIEDFGSEESIRLLGVAASFTDYMRLGLDLPDGTSYTSDGYQIDVSDMDYLPQVLRGEDVLTEVVMTKVENLPCFSVVVPLYRNGEVVGALRGVYPDSALLGAEALPAFGGEGYFILIDSKGNFLMKAQKASELYVETNVFEVYDRVRFQKGYDKQTIRADLEAGRSAFSVYELGGAYRCVYYTPAGINDWYVMSSVPVEYLLESTTTIKVTAAVLLGVLVCMSVLQMANLGYHYRKSADALELEKDNMRDILDGMPLPVFVTDQHRRLVQINQVAAAMIGRDRQSLLGKPCCDWNNGICGTDDCAIEKLLRTGDDQTALSHGGRDYRVHTVARTDQDGQSLGFIEVIQDVSELLQTQKHQIETIERMRAAEQALSVSSERYRIATEITRDIIIDYDFRTRVMYHTDQAKKIYGVAQQVQGAPESIVRAGVVSAGTAPGYLDMFRRMREGEQQVSCELLARAADGSDLWNRMKFTAIFDDNGQPVRAIGIIQDINREKEAELRYEREARYRSLTMQERDLYYEVDLTEGCYLSGQEKVASFLVTPTADYTIINDALLAHIVWPEDRDLVAREIASATLCQAYAAGEHKSMFQYRRVIPGDQSPYWVECTIYLFRDEESGHIRAIGYIRDISDTKTLELDLRQRAERDLLTGLYNKITTEHLITEHIAHTHAPGVFYIIDLDNFKHINDTCGHDMGDLVLAESAHRLAAAFTCDDIVGRLGGDEFVAFQTHAGSMEQVLATADRISGVFHGAYPGLGSGAAVSGSVGISLYPQHGATFHQLYRCADRALYQAKAKGKNTFSLSEAKQQEATPTREI